VSVADLLAGGHTTIDLERDVDGVAILWLDRPDHRNGITNTMMRELHHCLHAIARDPAIRVLVLTGRGTSFCPGADLGHYAAGGTDEPLRNEYFDVPVLLHEMPAVTIAAVNGPCAGAGLGFALACDLRWSARTARFNTAFLDVAVAGDMGVPWTLPRLVGAGRARHLSLLPRKLDADEALAIGMVDAVAEPEDLLDEVMAAARRIAGASPHARLALKSHYVAAERMGFADFVALETERHRAISASADTAEAFRAFVEKRPPVFGEG
jgi:2-(1,2-epoxy-1,2-dihydrophenyl)acetyl-CoA isomerase